MSQFSADVGPCSRSKFFTNAQLEALNLGYDGANLTWKGYIHLMVEWLQQVLNASDLARPGHPTNDVVRKTIDVFKLIKKYETSNRISSYNEIESELQELLLRVISENDSFSSNGVNPQTRLIEIHECMWDCLKYTTARDLFDKARMIDVYREIINGPQTNNLTNRITILENVWQVIDEHYKDACHDLPDKFVWGKEPFTKEWVKFRELIDGSGFVKTFPSSVQYVIIVIAMATTKFKHTELLKQCFRSLKHKQGNNLEYTELDWTSFCVEFEAAIYNTIEKIVPLNSTQIQSEPASSQLVSNSSRGSEV